MLTLKPMLRALNWRNTDKIRLAPDFGRVYLVAQPCPYHETNNAPQRPQYPLTGFLLEVLPSVEPQFPNLRSVKPSLHYRSL